MADFYLDIGDNDLSEMAPELLGQAVVKLKDAHLDGCELFYLFIY